MSKRLELIEGLRKIQRSLCAYDLYGRGDNSHKAPSMCDCKYGASEVGSASEVGNGCPEVREVIGVLETMTQREWGVIVRRAKSREVKSIKQMEKQHARRKSPTTSSGQ